MLDVFLDVILPVAIVALLGGVIGRWRAVTVAPLSSLVFYLFGPALVFNSLATTELSADVSFKIVGVMLATFVAMFAAATVWSLVRKHGHSMRAGFALAATSPNVGNMGLPVAQLAFGDLGLQIAVMNFVAGSVLVNSMGIAIASTAGGDRSQALRAPFRYPSMYAALAGVAFNAFGVDLPTALEASSSTLAGATIPTMLVVLGLQLQNLSGRDHLLDTIALNVQRLLIAPIAAWGAATALGLEGTTRGTLIVLAAMPAAVLTTILATEFRAEPGFVTHAVVTSTLCSIVTLTLLIALVK
ncbi:MAG TPA: AEC family transporter [Dehalococcoidia bacterium]|nr:AEC family transporter [Dehalococcoidia bacterium]